jgi:hypothetical protein
VSSNAQQERCSESRFSYASAPLFFTTLIVMLRRSAPDTKAAERETIVVSESRRCFVLL